MSEQTPQDPDLSGNRWEPTPAAVPAPASNRRVTRARAVGAGVAATVLIVGGVGGFAVGRVTAGDGSSGDPGQRQVDVQRDGGPGGGPGGGPNGGQDGFGDRDGVTPPGTQDPGDET